MAQDLTAFHNVAPGLFGTNTLGYVPKDAYLLLASINADGSWQVIHEDYIGWLGSEEAKSLVSANDQG